MMGIANRITTMAIALAGTAMLVSCSEDPLATIDAVEPVSRAPKDALSKEIEGLTGAHTRIVWAQQQNSKKQDKHGNGLNFSLMGFDTRDGKGARVIPRQGLELHETDADPGRGNGLSTPTRARKSTRKTRNPTNRSASW